MSSTFKMVDLGLITNILGIKVERNGDTVEIRLSQNRYIEDLLEKFGMGEAKIVSQPVYSNGKISKNMCPVSFDEKNKTENCLIEN